MKDKSRDLMQTKMVECAWLLILSSVKGRRQMELPSRFLLVAHGYGRRKIFCCLHENAKQNEHGR